MRIGYACINESLACRGAKTFRLASYSADRIAETVEANLDCLAQTLEYNREHGLLLFRISSDLIPFGSHPVCEFPWRTVFRDRFRELGAFVQTNGMRVAMHPDQFTVINAQDAEILQRSLCELQYHAAVLDSMRLASSHKIQIHVGGAYKDKESSIRRFIAQAQALPEAIRRRLVIENDDRLFSLADCIAIHEATGLPVVFDALHHAINNDDTTLREGLGRAALTWSGEDGPALVDYSSQEPGKRPGAHAATIDLSDFRRFLLETYDYSFDLMLEIKDKEASALKALRAAKSIGK